MTALPCTADVPADQVLRLADRLLRRDGGTVHGDHHRALGVAPALRRSRWRGVWLRVRLRDAHVAVCTGIRVLVATGQAVVAAIMSSLPNQQLALRLPLLAWHINARRTMPTHGCSAACSAQVAPNERGASTAQPSAPPSEAAHDGQVRKGFSNLTVVCRLAVGGARAC